VVLPTIDERPNLEKLLPEILASLEGCAVLVVDDASVDGTADFAEQEGRATGRVFALRRRGPPGLGRAYVDGFLWALAHSKARCVVQMDADGSHSPAHLRSLVAAVRAGADLVVGSRYIHGGRIVGWDPRRLALSRFAAGYARALTGLPLRDPTSGLRCLSRTALEALNPATLRSQGYAFQLEVAWRAWRADLRLLELPIEFIEREHGRSKLTLQIAGEAAWLCWRLRRGARSGE
jgi:glycosyltransferase involved in cell wall biosynthesis